ncbi:MAG TPA: preprotein translocase subunit SecE [Armatimonadota bacterium]|jgi:preprotein translocase subunit SecE
MSVNKGNAVNSTAAPTVKRPESQGNFIEHTWKQLGHFIQEVMVELKKTDWPSRNELTKFTVVVMATIFAVAIYLYFSDSIAAFIMQKLLPIHSVVQ